MNITELDSYRLSDAVKFHNRLNPKLWGRDEHLLPEVRDKLMEIAADFQEFLGVSDLDVQDITISGSNAAFSYTPHSDIDLHLVVRKPVEANEVYQELFNAKKYQYNDMHDIRIHGADVELYVQDAAETPVSLGEYSVKNGEWIQVPKKKRAQIDQSIVKHKYEDLRARIESALKDDSAERIAALIAKIKTMRQTGLDQHGEFGPENLAFKILRKQGLIKQLYDAQAAARDRELSLQERKKKQRRVRYGFGGYWFPGYGFGQGNDSGEGGGDGGGESVREVNTGIAQGSAIGDSGAQSTWDGVSPDTDQTLTEDNNENIVQEFIASTAQRLGIENMPEIELHRDADWSKNEQSFGMYEPSTHTLHVNMANRHLMDILRTTAHELVHCRQHELSPLPGHAGETGSRWENQAHATAGVIMRDYADAHPELFEKDPVTESSGYIPTAAEKNDPRFKMALSQDVKPGATGLNANRMALKTDSQGRPGLLIKGLKNALREFKQTGRLPKSVKEMDSLGNQDVTGPETPPTMPKGTVRVDVSDLYDWYKLGQHISNMKGLGRHDFGKGPPSAIVSFGDEDTEHQYIKDLEATGLEVTDIDPRDPQQPPGMKKIKTDPTYNVDEEEDIVESLHREFELLEDEVLGEIKMSPSNLRAEAAKTGALAGMEFEMIVPNISNPDDDVEYEPNYDMDERCRSITQAVDFFHDGDYNGRREVERLRERMKNDYAEWLMEQIDNDWANDKDDIIRNYVQENVDPAEWWALVNDNTSEEEAFEQFVADIVDDPDNAYYEEALDEFRELKYEDYDESDWLSDQDLDLMSNIESAYEISWPHWHEESRGGAADIDAVADSFSEAIGRPVNASSSYHGARREAGKYVVEPDGSLDPDDSNDSGLEFVSPPLPLDELLSDLNRVKKWADQTGCYTNKSTGLHINISVPDYDRTRLDYVKLALLLGDQYVLDQFGRSSNNYAKSAMGKVQDIIRQYPTKAQYVLDKMRGHMDDFATKAIHSGSTDKYTSINTKEGYIEFRSPGGDWLDANFDKIENTLMRFTVALSAAMDPEAYREEYQKKLYKLLTQNQDKTNVDTIRHFADYVAGKIPQAALRSFVKQAQLARKVQRGKTGSQLMWWEVSNPYYSNASIQVVASTKEEAIDKALGPDGYPSWASTRQTVVAEPVKPYDESPAKAREAEPQPVGSSVDQTNTHTYRAFNTTNNQTIGTFQAGEPGSDSAARAFAELLAREDMPDLYADYEVIGQERRPNRPNIGTQTDMENRLGWSDQTSDANYEIVDRRTMQPVFVFIANTEADAANKYQQWLAAAGYSSDPQELGWRRLETTQATPQQPSGEFTGNWLIQDPQGRTIHRFGGVGNVQSDANRVAVEWLRAHPGSMQAGVTVVPEMS